MSYLQICSIVIFNFLLHGCCMKSSPNPEGPGLGSDSKLLLSRYSPDKKKLMTIIENGSSTNVYMTWPCGGSSVYSVEGTDKNLKAYWKNNSTIVIETYKSYAGDPRLDKLNKRKQVQFLKDIVQVEYIEK